MRMMSLSGNGARNVAGRKQRMTSDDCDRIANTYSETKFDEI